MNEKELKKIAAECIADLEDIEFIKLHIGYSYHHFGYGLYLRNKYMSRFPNAHLVICSTESAVKEHLESWAKEIDIYSFTPIEDYIENKDVINWLHTGDFLIQLIDQDYGLVDKSRLITDSAVNLISFDNIQITNQTDDNTDYSFTD